jgi:uncharacterized protein (TIGR02246 family)
MPVRKPEDMSHVWSEAFNRGDLDALIALYEPGATLTRREGPSVVGHAAIRETFGPFLATKPHIDTTTRVIHVAGDVALTYGDWTLRGMDADGTAREASGHSTEVLRRQADGAWRYIIDDPYSA